MASDISNVRRPRREPAIAVDFMKAFAAIGCLICVLLLLALMWLLVPTNSAASWHTELMGAWVLVFFAPLATLLWATISPPSSEMGSYKCTRRLIQFHAMIASLTMLAGCALWQEFGPPLVLSALFAVGALLIDLVILFWSPWIGFEREDVHTYRVFQLRLVGGILAAVTIWSFANIGLVVWQAQYLSSGRPYCLEVASRGFGYRPATSLLDLNGLTMRGYSGQGNLPDTFHAVLVIDAADGLQWRNWSYLFQHFARIEQSPAARSRIRPSCQPRIDFALQLPLW